MQKKYNVEKLVYFEELETFQEAIDREKQVKAGSRNKKIQLINKLNPNWHDLFHEICSDDEGEEIASSRGLGIRN